MYLLPTCGEGNGNPLQYSYLENPMDRGAWWVAVHGVAKSRTRLSDFTFTFHFHALEKETATHSSVLAWRIPGTGEPGGLLSMGSHRVGYDWRDLAAAAAALPTWSTCSCLLSMPQCVCFFSYWFVDLPDPGFELTSPCLLHWQADSLSLFYLGSPIWIRVGPKSNGNILIIEKDIQRQRL